MITRTDYLNKLIDNQEPSLIKVITGIRRCGKSTLLDQFHEYLISANCPEEAIIHIKRELPQFQSMLTAKELFDYITPRIGKAKHLLIDEVQLIESWEMAINSYKSLNTINIVITGSTSRMLSSKLGSLLTGRYISINMLPFSFREYCAAFEGENKEQLLNNYIKYGAFPLVAIAPQIDTKIMFLNDLLNSIIARDVVPNLEAEVLNKKLPMKLISFIYDSIGYPISINKITNSLKSLGYRTSKETIADYFATFQDAFLIYPCEEFNLKGRKRLGYAYKYYSVDCGLANIANSFGSQHLGTDLENIIFLELLRRGYHVSTGRYEDLEIDFIATKADKTIYFQVTESLLSPTVQEREFRSLKKIEDNYPKYILSLDRIDYSRDGIIHKNIIDFLLE